ncbi:hypothetical protein BLNAU_20234 [Blattamonas nauphoetae]|uniref:Uncharacterized protein n=1 Tax=Blattamonas nauphoetae TaxID=2049346 RepID=A0ABQ9WZA2_9EUKA|nr:hypothetical protein BLNAU_20234 [Blattamonas nauphoetae]
MRTDFDVDLKNQFRSLRDALNRETDLHSTLRSDLMKRFFPYLLSQAEIFDQSQITNVYNIFSHLVQTSAFSLLCCIINMLPKSLFTSERTAYDEDTENWNGSLNCNVPVNVVSPEAPYVINFCSISTEVTSASKPVLQDPELVFMRSLLHNIGRSPKLTRCLANDRFFSAIHSVLLSPHLAQMRAGPISTANKAVEMRVKSLLILQKVLSVTQHDQTTDQFSWLEESLLAIRDAETGKAKELARTILTVLNCPQDTLNEGPQVRLPVRMDGLDRNFHSALATRNPLPVSPVNTAVGVISTLTAHPTPIMPNEDDDSSDANQTKDCLARRVFQTGAMDESAVPMFIASCSQVVGKHRAEVFNPTLIESVALRIKSGLGTKTTTKLIVALSRMLKDAPSSMIDDVLSTSLVPAILSATSLQSSSEKPLEYYVLRILFNLSHLICPAHTATLVEDGVIPFLVQTLTSPSQCVQETSSAVLYNLLARDGLGEESSCSSLIQQQVRQFGVVDQLLRLFNITPSVYVKRQTVLCLLILFRDRPFLQSHPQNARDICQHIAEVLRGEVDDIAGQRKIIKFIPLLLHNEDNVQLVKETRLVESLGGFLIRQSSLSLSVGIINAYNAFLSCSPASKFDVLAAVGNSLSSISLKAHSRLRTSVDIFIKLTQ